MLHNHRLSSSLSVARVSLVTGSVSSEPKHGKVGFLPRNPTAKIKVLIGLPPHLNLAIHFQMQKTASSEAETHTTVLALSREVLSS